LETVSKTVELTTNLPFLVRKKFLSDIARFTYKRTAGSLLTTSDEIRGRDLQTLKGILRGPGNYPTPSPDKIQRLMQQGLIKKKNRRLAPTLKGRIVAWLSRHGG
jgi:hypothetical protein